MTIWEIVISVGLVFAALMMLTTAVAVWRAPNALTRANILGPTIAVGLPVLVAMKLLRDWTTTGFVINDFIRAIIAITSLFVVTSIASYYIGRSVHGIEKDKIIVDPPRKALVKKYGDKDQPTLIHSGTTATSRRDKAIETASQASRQHGGMSHKQKKKKHRSIHADHSPFQKEKHPNSD
ncbi:Na+/H+ antiporter subunit G [Corynebacterium mendelii]|uniref:Na+/H+ antiporter subunit G n=1 Tax=Corynebacterium mendelii TaxID=2765362 RepID=A0A939E122_9CORY|nr:Na+/H+ antiporter subunit G [Corynebacterium mendelii]MBN9643756.1 Na+/H+ antiporter subunit G [Corynebacterium mendelii]